MWFNIDHKITAERLKDTVDKWRVYMIFRIIDSDTNNHIKLYPPFDDFPPISLTSTGWLLSNRPEKQLTEHEQIYNNVEHGICVYYDRAYVPIPYPLMFFKKNTVILPCWGYKEDLIAFGAFYTETTFMKIQFIKEEVLEALKDYPEHIPVIMQQLFPEK